MSEMPKIGGMAPSFNLMNHQGEKISLKNFKGKNYVVLYFYPKAMTPGCTVQACGLRDNLKRLEKLGAVVLGVSPDSVERLEKFREKEGLNFDLLADEDQEISKKYGVWQKKKNYGREYMGIVRTTFIIGKDGKIKHIMENVKTKTHHDDVLELVQALSKS